MIPIQSSSNKRKRPLVGSQGEGGRSGGPDPEDPEIAPPSAPSLRVRPEGQHFTVTRKLSTGQYPNLANADGARQNRRSAVSATAKSVLYQIKESPNAYPPLKSIAGYLWHILNNSEV